MNTPAHLIFGMTVFGKRNRPALTGAAFAGSLIPDLSLYLLAGVHLLVLGTAPEVVFGQLYYSDAWQSIFRIDNSLVLWGTGFALTLFARQPVVVALCGAAVLHLCLDFLLHNDDARAHFWPLTDWVFYSPVSYWDPQHFGGVVGPVEVLLSLACCAYLWRRHRGRLMRVLVVALGLMELGPLVIWTLMFAHH